MTQKVDEVIGRKSVLGVMSYTLRTLFLYVIAVVATGLLSYYLTPSEFGVYYVVLSVIGIFTFFSDIGLAASLIQQKAEPSVNQLRAVFSVQLVLSLLIFLISIVLRPLWVVWGLNQQGLYLLWALSFSFILAALKTVPSILLERKLDFGRLVIPQMVEQIIFYGLAVVMAVKGFGIFSFTLAVIARSIAGLFTIYLIQRWPVGWHISLKTLSELLPYGIKFQANDLLARLKDDLYVVVVAKFLGVHEMGLLGWAKRWSMFPYQFAVNSVVSVTFPTMARIQDEPVRIGRGLEKAWFYISLLVFPILMGMWQMAYPLLGLIPRLEQWNDALLPLGLFSLNIAFAALANPAISVLNATGKISFTLKLMLVMVLVTWLTTPLALRYMNYTGVALTAVISAGFSLYAIVELKRNVDFGFMRNIQTATISSILMGIFLFTGRNWWSRSLGWLGIGILLGMSIYLGFVWIIDRQKVIRETQWLLGKVKKHSS